MYILLSIFARIPIEYYSEFSLPLASLTRFFLVQAWKKAGGDSFDVIAVTMALVSNAKRLSNEARSLRSLSPLSSSFTPCTRINSPRTGRAGIDTHDYFGNSPRSSSSLENDARQSERRRAKERERERETSLTLPLFSSGTTKPAPRGSAGKATARERSSGHVASSRRQDVRQRFADRFPSKTRCGLPRRHSPLVLCPSRPLPPRANPGLPRYKRRCVTERTVSRNKRLKIIRRRRSSGLFVIRIVTSINLPITGKTGECAVDMSAGLELLVNLTQRDL